MCVGFARVNTSGIFKCDRPNGQTDRPAMTRTVWTPSSRKQRFSLLWYCRFASPSPAVGVNARLRQPNNNNNTRRYQEIRKTSVAVCITIMRFAVLFTLLGSSVSFLKPCSHDPAATTRLAVLRRHQDPILPEDVRAERSEWIRDKLLGDDLHPEVQKPRKKKKADAHPHLTQMIKVLEEHIVHEEPIDPNC